MMFRRWRGLGVVLMLASLALFGCVHQNDFGKDLDISPTVGVDSVSDLETGSVSPSVFQEVVPFTARFEIYTLGTKRIFTNPRYHNQSSSVYLTAEEPSTVHVAERGATWADLFDSLPMSLDDKCLVTGTGQTFCSNQQHQLVFELNGQEVSEVLGQEIGMGDFLEVRYE